MYTSAYRLFLVLLIFAPMAFGTVETWSYTVMQTMICASAILFYFSQKRDQRYQVPGISLLLLVCGATLFQAIPLPPALVQFLSPASYEIYQSGAGVISPSQWITISVYPRSTLMEFLRISSYVLFYAIAVQFFSNRLLLKRTLAVIIAFGSLLAAFILVEFITRIMGYPVPHDKILWIRDSVHGAGSIGPYVNRNHYAGFGAMLFPLAVGLFLVHRRALLVQKQHNSLFLYGMAAVLIGASVFVTLSRGGIISVTASMIMLSVFLIFKTRQKRSGIFVGAIFFLVLCLSGTNAWHLAIERFDEIRSESGEIQTNRFHYWRDSAGIVQDFPMLGAGAGTFEKIYPQYRTFPGTGKLEHAHSDYIEFLSTGGIVISVTMIAALATIFIKSYKTYAKRRDRYSIYLFICSMASIFAVLLHSFVDFNMQVGANGLYFFFILAIAVSAAHTRFTNGANATYLKPSRIHFFIPVIAVIFFGAGVMLINYGALRGNYYFSEFRDMEIATEYKPQRLDMAYNAAIAASAADPWNPVYYHAAAKTSAVKGELDMALQAYKRLLLLEPLNSLYLQDAAYFFYLEGKKDEAFLLMGAGMKYDPGNFSTHINYASLLFQEGQVETGLNVLKSSMKILPAITDTCLALMAWFSMDEEMMQRALPDRVKPYLVFADYLLSKGYSEKAEAAYLTALSHIPNEPKVNRNFFMEVYRYYLEKDEYEKALEIIHEAIRHLPEDQRLQNIAENLYKRLGISEGKP